MIPLNKFTSEIIQQILNVKKKCWEYENFDNKKVIDGNIYLHFISKDDVWFLWANVLVFDGENGTEIGRAGYGLPNENSQLKAAIHVCKNKRRTGIASNIYEWIEELTGRKLYPDIPHSKNAEAFWNNPNRKFGYDK